MSHARKEKPVKEEPSSSLNSEPARIANYMRVIANSNLQPEEGTWDDIFRKFFFVKTEPEEAQNE